MSAHQPRCPDGSCEDCDRDQPESWTGGAPERWFRELCDVRAERDAMKARVEELERRLDTALRSEVQRVEEAQEAIAHAERWKETVRVLNERQLAYEAECAVLRAALGADIEPCRADTTERCGRCKTCELYAEQIAALEATSSGKELLDWCREAVTTLRSVNHRDLCKSAEPLLARARSLGIGE